MTIGDDGAPHAAPTAAGLAETHTAVLFFVGDRAYKIKKPVRFPFLDFSTRQLREQACHREVQLNRRIAADVYLGVATLSEPDRPEEPAEHAVVMRRMPEERSLAALVTAHDPSVLDHLRDIARVVAAFHAKAERGSSVTFAVQHEAVLRRWRTNFDEVAAYAGAELPVFDGALLERAYGLVEEFVAGRTDLFSHRAHAGFACDGHGDLQAADIYCLDDGPRILDCVEFDDQLRYVDVADDVAFLMMDLERLGSLEASAHLARSYAEFAGHPLPVGLVHHYVAYRALVRAKVSAVRWQQERESGDTSAAQALSGARQLLDLCVDHLERARVRLVLVGGLPGSGKTTLAETIGARRGWTVLRSDVLRKQMAGLESTTPAAAAFRTGLYEPSVTDAVYAELVQEASRLLRMGESVIVDASWAADHHRELARQLASADRARVIQLQCEVDIETARSRLRSRAEGDGANASDATPEIAGRMAQMRDAWPEAARVRTDRPAGELAAELDGHL